MESGVGGWLDLGLQFWLIRGRENEQAGGGYDQASTLCEALLMSCPSRGAGGGLSVHAPTAGAPLAPVASAPFILLLYVLKFVWLFPKKGKLLKGRMCIFCFLGCSVRY